MKQYCLCLWFKLCLVLSLAGCAIDPTKMVPDLTRLPQPIFAKTVRIGAVTGSETEVFGGPAYVQPDEFREALKLTLSEAGLFSKVIAQGDAGLALNSKFVVQGQTPEGLSFLASMVIEYTLSDTKTNSVLWKESFNSTAKRTVGDDFAGGTRSSNAQIYCAKSNLAQMVEALKGYGLGAR